MDPAAFNAALKEGQDRTDKLVGLVSFCIVFAGTIVGFRIYSRLAYLRKLRVDDYLMLAALASFIAQGIGSIIAVQHGIGHRQYTIPLDQIKPALMALYHVRWLYGLTLGLAKLSTLAFYTSLPFFGWFRIFLHSVTALVTAMTISLVFAYIFQCVPVSLNWEVIPPIPQGYCVDARALGYGQSSLNVATDMLVLLLPLNMVRKLRIPIRQKLCLLPLFMLGTIVCAISIIRLTSVYTAFNSQDLSWAAYDISKWSSLETSLAIVTSSLPHCKPLLVKLVPNKWRTQAYLDKENRPADSLTLNTPYDGTR